MKFLRPSRHCGVLSLALASSFPVAAQSAGAPSESLREVVVTATRVAQPIAELVADMTVIDRDQIDRAGAAGLVDVLRQVPGIEMSRNGGPGATSSMFIRGAETRFTAVFIDGVRVDSQSTGGASWEAIPLSLIDRIEILRGPAAAVYGSDAMGGVVQLFTRKGEARFAPYVSVGLGTYATSRLEAGISGGDATVDYAIGMFADYSKGFNARPGSAINADDDGYRNQGGHVRFGVALSADHRLDASLLSNDLRSQYDATSGDDLNLRSLQTGSLLWKGRWSEAYRTTLSMSDSQDRYETKPNVYQTTTQVRSYLFQNEISTGQHRWSAALERREDRLNNATTTPVDTLRAQNGVSLGYGWVGPVHTVQFNARHDLDSEFGAQNTGALAYAMAFAPGWRASASVASAFRAPTLYQRFSVYGTPDVLPETSRNAELGLRYQQSANEYGLTVYRNEVRNLITYVSGSGTCTNNLPPVALSSRGCYLNTAQAFYRGITFSAAHRFSAFRLQGSLDFQDPRDGVTGKLLARRSHQHATLGLDTAAAGWNWGAQVLASGLRYDNAANTTALPGYVLLNLTASKTLEKDWTLLLRVDNANDAAYQLANTYGTPGRSLFVGLKWAP